MRRTFLYRIFLRTYTSPQHTALIGLEGKLILVLLILLIQAQLFAQNSADRAYIIGKTNVEKLKQLSILHNNAYLKGIAKKGHTTKNLIITKKGKTGYLSGFDEKGKPVYDIEENLVAAKSIRTNIIWSGGLSGLNLDGTDIEIGQWEAGGLPMDTHRELAGKITLAETEEATGHATHTACTMIGTGISNAARGMASGATVVSRKSNNDESEIAEFAALGGILSNHSYGTNSPDGDSSLYGVYNGNSTEWDEILYNAPYLFLCKSAGNNRNDEVNVEDGGFDILYTIALSKNLLTIGAVDDVFDYSGPGSVLQSDFSSWGPTDDWRIKPDLVANGVGVYSANDLGNSSYISRNGSSMACASVAGTVALLQQHYHTLYGVYMKAATVKALLLCTTDELGENEGPDFRSGWGLVNAEEAAYAISNNSKASLISELSISDGELYNTEIEVDGLSPVSIAIAWTDPPGMSGSGHDDLSPKLINDLDLRISGNGLTYEPWLMVPNSSSNNFDAPAIKGDNFRDNVERVDINNLPSGTYTITVSHKGNLVNDAQDFSLVAKGLLESTLSVGDQDRLNKSIRIYPVPLQEGDLRIEIPEEFYSLKYKTYLFDSYGKLMDLDVFYDKQIILNLSHLSSGVYFVRIVMDNLVEVKRIVIE